MFCLKGCQMFWRQSGARKATNPDIQLTTYRAKLWNTLFWFQQLAIKFALFHATILRRQTLCYLDLIIISISNINLKKGSFGISNTAANLKIVVLWGLELTVNANKEKLDWIGEKYIPWTKNHQTMEIFITCCVKRSFLKSL